jgi:GAF domain-containing protein
MSAASPPDNESRRLAALESFRLLRTGEGWFDQIALYAAERCGAPIAMVAFLDETEEWLKAAVGIDVAVLDRPHSLCAHAVSRGVALWVEDARQDHRFADHPLVTGPPGIRSYACALIAAAEGLHLGAVAIADTQARGFDVDAARLLRDLAGVVAVELRDRRAGRRFAVSSG